MGKSFVDADPARWLLPRGRGRKELLTASGDYGVRAQWRMHGLSRHPIVCMSAIACGAHGVLENEGGAGWRGEGV